MTRRAWWIIGGLAALLLLLLFGAVPWFGGPGGCCGWGGYGGMMGMGGMWGRGGMMGRGWGGGMAWGPAMFVAGLFPLLFFGLIVAGGVFLGLWAFRQWGPSPSPAGSPASPSAVATACPQCGRPVAAEWRVCPHCGTPLRGSASTATGPDAA